MYYGLYLLDLYPVRKSLKKSNFQRVFQEIEKSGKLIRMNFDAINLFNLKNSQSPILNIDDLYQIQALSWEEREISKTVGEFMFDPNRDLSQSALQFFLQADKYDSSIEYTYEDCQTAILQTSQLLLGLGTQKEDKIAILLPNIPEHYFAFWGAAHVAIAAPLHPMTGPDKLVEQLNQLQARILITLAPFPTIDLWQKVEEVRENLPNLKYILQVDMADYLKGIGKVGARFSMFGKGKAKKIPGQQLGDFNRSRKKIQVPENAIFNNAFESDEPDRPISAFFLEKGLSLFNHQDFILKGLGNKTVPGSDVHGRFIFFRDHSL